MIMNLSPRKKLFVDTAAEMFGAGATLTKSMTKDAAAKAGVPFPTWFRKSYSVGYNAYKLPSEGSASAPITAAPAGAEAVVVNLFASNMEKQNLVPAPFEGFVSWGHFSTIEKIVKSGLFYPIFITGLSGNGKTLMVEQVHAKLNKELIRVNITIETAEDLPLIHISEPTRRYATSYAVFCLKKKYSHHPYLSLTLIFDFTLPDSFA